MDQSHGVIEMLAKKQLILLVIMASAILTVFIFLDTFFGMYISMFILGMVFLAYNFWYRRIGLPPGPTPLPLAGNYLDVDVTDPSKSFAKISEKYGGIFTIFLPDPIIVITSRDLLFQALKMSKDIFAGRPTGPMWSIFTGNLLRGNGMILCEGKVYKEVKALALRILKADFGMGYTKLEAKILNNVIELKNYVNLEMNGTGQCDLDMEAPLSLCVANVIQTFVVGQTYTVNDPNFYKFKSLIDAVLKDVASEFVQMHNSWPILHYLPNKTMKRYVANGFKLQEYFLLHIERVRASMTMEGDASCFMEAFLRACVQNPEAEHCNPLTLALASGDLWTGGMETTVTILLWLIIYLIRNEVVQEKCYQEIVEVFGDNDPSYRRRAEMKFVNATIAETLRVVNVLPWAIPHRTTEDTILYGFVIKKHTIIMPQFGATHLDPTLYPEPKKFRPQRYIENPELLKMIVPFGLGVRSCIGQSLASYELFLITIVLIQRFKFEKIPGEPEPSLTRTKGMTNKPLSYRCRVTKR